MIAAKNGYIAEFKTAYLQVEYSILAKVSGGMDNGLRNPTDMGISTSRLVKLTADAKQSKFGDADLYTITPVDTIAEADAIIAQADDTVKDEYLDFNYVERLTTMPNGIVKNSNEYKRVSIFKIKDKDDVKLIKISEPVVIETAANKSGTFTVGANTYQIIPVGTNSYKVVGTIEYDSTPLFSAGAGDILYLQIAHPNIKKADLPNGNIYKRISPIVEIGPNYATKNDFDDYNDNKGSMVQVGVNVNDHGTSAVRKEFEIQIAWTKDADGNLQFTTYKFDLTDAKEEDNA